MTRDKGLIIIAALVLSIPLAACARIRVVDAGRDPLTPEEHMRLGAVYEARNEDDLALREYRDAALSAPGSVAAWFGLGNVYLKKKMYGEAVDSYLKAVELDPNNGAIHNNLGWAYMESGRLDKAETAARDALRLDPAGRHIYLDTLGVIETKRGEYSDAKKSLEEAAASASPGDREGLRIIYGHLLDLCRATGDSAGAAVTEEKIKALEAGQTRR